MKLTDQDHADLVYLAGCALNGILADHAHIRQIKDLSCGQSVAEWASTLAIETHYRLMAKIGRYVNVMDTPVKIQVAKRMTRKTRLYPKTYSL